MADENEPWPYIGMEDKAIELGARKVVCFQRHAWYEGVNRSPWWDANPPNRTWIMAARASCWRIDIPPELRGVPKDKGGAGSGTPTAHSWFVWEPALPVGTISGRLVKDRSPLPWARLA